MQDLPADEVVKVRLFLRIVLEEEFRRAKAPKSLPPSDFLEREDQTEKG